MFGTRPCQTALWGTKQKDQGLGATQGLCDSNVHSKRGENLWESQRKESPISTCRRLRLLQRGHLPSPPHLHKLHSAGSGVLNGSEVHLYPPSLTCAPAAAAGQRIPPSDLGILQEEPLRPVLPLVRQMTTDKPFIVSVLVLSLEEWTLILLRNNSRNVGTSPLYTVKHHSDGR